VKIISVKIEWRKKYIGVNHKMIKLKIIIAEKKQEV